MASRANGTAVPTLPLPMTGIYPQPLVQTFPSRWGKGELPRAVLSEKASAPTKRRPHKRWGLRAYFTSSVIETCNECSMQDYHH